MRAHQHSDLFPAGFDGSRAAPLPSRWRRSRLSAASPLDAVAARLRAHWLDAELAAGVKSWHSPAHAARALQVTSDFQRQLLAGWLERLLDEAYAEAGPPSRFSAKIRPSREQVLTAESDLLALADRLRAHTTLDAGAAVRLRALLADGGGPCYRSTRPGALRDALVAIADELELPD